MKGFSLWMNKAYMTAHNEVFDIGETTEKAIKRFDKKFPQSKWGLNDEMSNGNGSLMRIHPLAIYLAKQSDEEIVTKSFEISELTHAHIRSKLACAYFCILLKYIINGNFFTTSYKITNDFLRDLIIKRGEFKNFERILSEKILTEPKSKIKSSGYVIDTLESSLWCVANTKNLKSAILKAVNLGEDSDTTGAVTGALVGAIYGYKEIPEEWLNSLAKKGMISNVVEKFIKKLKNYNHESNF